LAEAEAFFSDAYSRLHIAAGSSGRTPSRFRRRETGALQLDRLDLGFDMRYAVEPLGRVCLMRLHSGRWVENRTAGVTESFRPGDVALLATADQPYRGRLAHADYTLTLFDPKLFDRIAATESPHAGGVRLTGHRPVSPGAAAQLRRSLDFVHELLTDPIAAQAQLLVGAAERLVAGGALTAFPNNAVDDPSAADRNDAHTDTLRRAIAFIEANPHRDIAVRDIAAAAYVGVRAVQLAFRRHLDTTPMAYLRGVRLDCAHRDLLAADPARTTVAAVARRWGFANSGRFAGAYRSAHNCTPGQTLHS
jgi:AraC-like DNA-binding protein